MTTTEGSTGRRQKLCSKCQSPQVNVELATVQVGNTLIRNQILWIHCRECGYHDDSPWDNAFWREPSFGRTA